MSAHSLEVLSLRGGEFGYVLQSITSAALCFKVVECLPGAVAGFVAVRTFSFMAPAMARALPCAGFGYVCKPCIEGLQRALFLRVEVCEGYRRWRAYR